MEFPAPRTLCSLLAPAILVIGGCGSAPREPAPITYASSETANAASATGSDDDTAERRFPGIRFQVPTYWQDQPKSQFYDSKFVIPSEHGEMTLTMTTMGGGIDGNFARWQGQFQLDSAERPRRETLSVDGITSHWIDVRGTYSSSVGSDLGPHPDWRLLGVAIPIRPKLFLMKLIGPQQAVADFHEEFRRFVRSAGTD